MLLYLYFILWMLLNFVCWSDAVYVGGTAHRMKVKFVSLDRELVLDAINNYRRVEIFLEDPYEMDRAYHIGKLLVEIRSKFGRMLRLHALSHNNFDAYDQNKHILHLAEVQHLSMDIDNLVQIILDYEWDDDHGIKKPPKMGKLPPRVRNGTRKVTTAQGLRFLGTSPYNQEARQNSSPLRSDPQSNIWKTANDRIFENNGGNFDSDIN